MLTKTTIGADSICTQGFLHNNFVVNSIVRILYQRSIQREQARVNSDAGYVESVGPSESTESVNGTSECAECTL